MPDKPISKYFEFVNLISKISNNVIVKDETLLLKIASTILIINNPLCHNTESSIYFCLHTVYKGIIFGNALTLFSILKSRYKSWKKKVLIIIVKTPTLFGDKVEKEQFIFVSSPSFKFTSWHLWNKNNVYEEKN